MGNQSQNGVDELLRGVTVDGDEAREEGALRPESFSAYIGQEPIKQSLQIAIGSARQREAPVDHILLYGPPGLGKTSLAYLVAREMGSGIHTTSGPAITKAGDLAALITNLSPGQVLFIDEVHRLPRPVEEILYPAMEDRCLDIMLGKGPSARSVRIDLPPFTLIGATTRVGLLSHPLRERFGLTHHLEYYDDAALAQILARSSRLLGLDAGEEALTVLAQRSRRTPRVANRLLRRVRDFAVYHRREQITPDLVVEALDQLDVDPIGLHRTDRSIINVLHHQFQNGPVGLDALAAATGEEAQTLEDVVEPYLMQIGFLDRTPRGRVLTDNALRYFGWTRRDDQLSLG